MQLDDEGIMAAVFVFGIALFGVFAGALIGGIFG
jgi:hypothetical protein